MSDVTVTDPGRGADDYPHITPAAAGEIAVGKTADDFRFRQDLATRFGSWRADRFATGDYVKG
jgi:hypothetical protein